MVVAISKLGRNIKKEEVIEMFKNIVDNEEKSHAATSPYKMKINYS